MTALECMSLWRKQVESDTMPVFVEMTDGLLLDIVDVYGIDPNYGFDGKLILVVGQEVLDEIKDG